MSITVEQLYQSYGAYLRAKVQELESVGSGMNIDFRKTIADHQELEARYIREMLATRREGSLALKAQLDAFDAQQKPRRLR